jgi:3-hydroxyisobutyrate dehydrogenase-like beta-hydroxyacid dehydrogenase
LFLDGPVAGWRIDVEPIGLIGLGLMGSALAERFRAAGLRVIGFDLREDARSRLLEIGGEAVASVSGVFSGARVVVISLPNSEVVAEVIRDAGESLLGATIIDTTTGDPVASERIGMLLAERGTDYLDATLTGSSAQARAGEVLVTAGGRPEVFAAAELTFRMFARRWFHVGRWGSGARVKLAINLVLGLNRAVLAEGLAFARGCGMDPGAVLEILRESAAYSRVMDTKGWKMIEHNFAPEARLEQHLKDVRLIIEAGERAGASLPFSVLHERLLDELTARGLGELDNTGIIRAFEGDGGAP